MKNSSAAVTQYKTLTLIVRTVIYVHKE